MAKQPLEQVTLYRAGSPSEGAEFWTPSESYAREQSPTLAMHEATLLPGARIKELNELRVEAIVGVERELGLHDVLVFSGPPLEVVVLNPAVLKIVK